MLLPLCRDICDYPVIIQLDAKVCVILVSWRPVCVTVIEFVCVTANEFYLCDGDNEFHLCDSK